MTPQIANHLTASQIQTLIAAAPPAAAGRLRQLSIEKSSDSARRHASGLIAALAQMEVQIVAGQQLDQVSAADLHGLVISLHSRLDGVLQLNAGVSLASWAAPRADDDAPSDERAFAQGGPAGDEDSDDPAERRQHGRAGDRAGDRAGASVDPRASARAGARAEDRPPARRPPQRAAPFAGSPSTRPPPIPKERLFRLYTPSPLPDSPRAQFDRDYIRPAEGVGIGAIACANSDGVPAQAAIIGMYTIKGFPQYMAINLNEPLALGAFGSPGSGKTYLKGVIVESFLTNLPRIHINDGLLQPGCVVALRVGDGPEIALDHLAAAYHNHVEREAEFLWALYEGLTTRLRDFVILCLPEDVMAYRKRYPFAIVLPIQMALKSLSAVGFNALMGVHKGRSPLYLRELGKSLRSLRARGQGTLADLREAIADLHLSGESRKLAQHRLDLIEPFVDESVDLRALLKPGRLIQIAISTESLLPDDALLLASLVTDILALHPSGKGCPLLVDLDEAHTLMDGGLMEQMIETLLRRRRQLGVGTILCTHSPKSLKKHLLSLLDGIALYRADDADSLRHLGDAVSVFKLLAPEKCATMPQGHAFFWSSRYYPIDRNPSTMMSADVIMHMEVRQRATLHGGATVVAVEDDRPPRWRYH